MRNLFISECRYIKNILAEFTNVDVPSFGPVIQEYYAPPRAKNGMRFNNDYFLDFVSVEERREVKARAYGAAVLPNTLGAQVFLTIDEVTSKPLMTELLGGEAFPIKYFRDQVEIVESQLAGFSWPVDLRRSSYCRIFVVGGDICFLAFLDSVKPDFRGRKEIRSEDGVCSIACSFEQGKLICVDGWIRTHVVETDRKLEAIGVF